MSARAYYGPRPAYYSAVGHRLGTSDRDGAHGYVASQWDRHPDERTVSRAEGCPVPGCHGGEITIPGGKRWRTKPCPHHVASTITIEPYDRDAAARYWSDRVLAQHNDIDPTVLGLPAYSVDDTARYVAWLNRAADDAARFGDPDHATRIRAHAARIAATMPRICEACPRALPADDPPEATLCDRCAAPDPRDIAEIAGLSTESLESLCMGDASCL